MQNSTVWKLNITTFMLACVSWNLTADVEGFTANKQLPEDKYLSSFSRKTGLKNLKLFIKVTLCNNCTLK